MLIPLLEQIPLRTKEVREALPVLATWDRQTTAESPGAALYELTLYRLQKEVYQDLGQGFAPYSDRLGQYYTGLNELLRDPESLRWTTTRSELLERALSSAVRDARARMGDDPRGWRWGLLHHVVFHHPLGRRKPLNLLLDRTLPYGGDSDTINNGAWSALHPFDLEWGSSYRLLVDLADPAHAKAVNTTGESGRPFTRHYDDMMRPWAEVRYHTLWTEESDILAHRDGELLLKPQSSKKGP